MIVKSGANMQPIQNEVSETEDPTPLKLSQLKTLELVMNTYQCPRYKAELAVAKS